MANHQIYHDFRPPSGTHLLPSLDFMLARSQTWPMTKLASIHSAPGFPEPEYITTKSGKFAIYQSGPVDTTSPPILLVHGWPEIAYSWKNQIKSLADSGYRVIAIDLKGFGNSDNPKDPNLYDIIHLTDDLANILDSLSIEQAVICGHDWGGAIVWPMAVLHPARVAGVIGVCTPHLPAPPVAPLGIIEKRFGPKHYFVQFQEFGKVEKVFTGQEEKFFRIMFRKPAPRDQWEALVPRIYDLPGRLLNGTLPNMNEVIVTRENIDIYISAYKQSGFHGGINLYRNLNLNWEIMKDRDITIKKPSLWVGAELDLFLPPEASLKMDDLVENLTRKTIADSGHWVMWEKPDILNDHIINWLKATF